jgi:hypothetical protein
VGVDAAFLSRADLVENIGLPGAAAAEQILRDTLEQVVGTAGLDGAPLGPLAKACVDAGLDARRVRKLVLRALASRRDLAMSPERLRVEDIASALRAETR